MLNLNTTEKVVKSEVELTDLSQNFAVKNDALLVFIFDIKVNIELFKAYGQIFQLFSTEPSERCCEQTPRTISGRRCQKWNSKSPHEPNQTMLDYLRRHDLIFNHLTNEIL